MFNDVRPPKSFPIQSFDILSNSIKKPSSKSGHQNLRRDIFINTGVLDGDGSAYLEFGNTKVSCIVNGPKEPSTAGVRARDDAISRQFHQQNRVNLEVSIKFSNCSMRMPSSTTAADEAALATSVKEAFSSVVCLKDLGPCRCQIEIFVHILDDDGGVESAILTCVSLALINAGIPCFDILTAATVACPINDDSRSIVDPSIEDIGAAFGQKKVTVGYMSSMDQIAYLNHDGSIGADRLMSAIDLAIDSCRKLDEHSRRHLRSSMSAERQSADKKKEINDKKM